MPPALPASVKHLVVGAGVHGLSTAWHLAEQGEQVLVVDKSGVAAGASGIACGVVRNNYFQPAMSELMASCVEIWESDPETFNYYGSGYVALGEMPGGGEAVHAGADDEVLDRAVARHQWSGGSQPSSTFGCQSAPTVLEFSTHGPSSGCGNLQCCSFSRIP